MQAVVRPRDLVWLHDFHLCLVPGLLRAAGVPASVGVFWHIPFPPPTVFGICRWRAELLSGLLGADLIAFQTEPDVRNFLESVRQFLGVPVSDAPARVRLPEREVGVFAHPIGIDYETFRAHGSDATVQTKAERLRTTLGAEVVMLGVDRLDYTKGILERLRGYERFLERRPEWRRRVCLVQVAVPSRDRLPDYRDMKRSIDEAVGRIVGRFTSEGRPPLQYVYTALSREQLAAYYSAADIALVTPLRDGMNLVAKEYVAARVDHGGCLVLSEFAGAASQLRQAYLVNPHDLDGMKDTMIRALDANPADAARRMRAMRRNLRTNDVQAWARSYLAALCQG